MIGPGRRHAWWVAAVVVALIAGCSPGDSSSREVQSTAVSTQDIATGLTVPWGVTFLPDGTALIAERDTGAVKHLTAPGQLREIGNVTGVVPRGEAGLLGLAVSPDFAQDQTVFAYFTADADNRVVATRFDGNTLTDQRPILTGIPAARIHDGGRIFFGPDGKLYVTTGDAGNSGLAQDKSSLGGKILRIDPDGSIPVDNPDPASPVWSYGHRNVQGLAWDAQGRMWATEYGANTWDEVNLIEPDGNYGWPEAEGRAGIPGLIDPQVQWGTGEASPSGLAYAAGSLWVAALRGERLWQVPISADGALGEPVGHFVEQYGRLRTVVAAPDGALWFTTSNRDGRGDPQEGDDRIVSVQPDALTGG